MATGARRPERAEEAAQATGQAEAFDVKSEDVRGAALAALGEEPLCPDIYAKCRCKKGNPLCLAGLVPGPAGFRRKGLWQKDAKALVEGGRDPGEDKRQVQCSPALCRQSPSAG